MELKEAKPLVEGISKLLFPFAEVVLHNIKKNKIEAIYNSFSKRCKDDNSYLERWDFTANPIENVIGPYEKINFDGRKLKSISIVIRNQKGEAKGFLCINIDLSAFNGVQNILNLFLETDDLSIPDSTKCLFKDDLYEQINAFVQNYCLSNQLKIEVMNKDHKKTLVQNLKEEGALKGKNAAHYIARILNISRATVYNYLMKN